MADSKASDTYKPPSSELTRIMTVGDLLGGTRTVLATQQSRLGFEAEGLNLRLWCAGDTTIVRAPESIAVVGTRDVSFEGAARSRRLAKELVSAGVVVYSGLAKGVDTEALTEALKYAGKVVAVVGTPINQAYPAENKRLQEQIYREGLLISQFAPGTRVYRSSFPERNKLMAALSDGTAIIEAGQTSGTLHQAAECVRLGRWLFVAQSVMDNPALTWPAKFMDYNRFRVLRKTGDILNALRGSESDPVLT